MSYIITHDLNPLSAMFVLHHPEHGHAVVLPIISCIIDGTLVYDRSYPPFASFISLVCPSSEVCHTVINWNNRVASVSDSYFFM